MYLWYLVNTVKCLNILARRAKIFFSAIIKISMA